MLRILLSIGLALLVLGGAFTYMARRSMSLCPALSRHPRLVWGFFGLFLGSMFLVPLINRLANHQADFLYWISYGLFSFVSTYLVYLAVADLAQALVRRWTSAPVGLWAFQIALGATALSVLVGLVMAVRQPGIKQVNVPIAGLPQGLDGFRIVQISDLHLGPLVPMAKVQRLVERTNDLKADLIAITGDLVDGEANGVKAKAEAMAKLNATHGVFFVTGNHEYYSGIEKWIPLLKGLGWKILDNKHVVIEQRDARLAVIGMPDPAGKGRRGNGEGPNLVKAITGVPEGATKLLLFHPPTGFESADKGGIALQLSGHTHSGQYFPWSLFIPSLYRFPKGLNRQGALWIYTSVGTGFWGPPNRFLVAPELTVLTLRKA